MFLWSPPPNFEYLQPIAYHEQCGPLRVSRLPPSPLLSLYLKSANSLGYKTINCNEGTDIGKVFHYDITFFYQISHIYY